MTMSVPKLRADTWYLTQGNFLVKTFGTPPPPFQSAKGQIHAKIENGEMTHVPDGDILYIMATRFYEEGSWALVNGKPAEVREIEYGSDGYVTSGQRWAGEPWSQIRREAYKLAYLIEYKSLTHEISGEYREPREGESNVFFLPSMWFESIHDPRYSLMTPTEFALITAKRKAVILKEKPRQIEDDIKLNVVSEQAFCSTVRYHMTYAELEKAGVPKAVLEYIRFKQFDGTSLFRDTTVLKTAEGTLPRLEEITYLIKPKSSDLIDKDSVAQMVLHRDSGGQLSLEIKFTQGAISAKDFGKLLKEILAKTDLWIKEG